VNFPDSNGQCEAGVCAYPPMIEACGTTCSAGGGLATCSSCNQAFAGLANGPVWTFESGSQGWGMTTPWSRRSSGARTGSWAMHTQSWSIYDPNVFSRNSWNWNADMRLCTSCPVELELWVRGDMETNFDRVQLRCSGNGGSNWTNVGDRITGRFSSWTQLVRSIPVSCLTDRMRLALEQSTDGSVEREGYRFDDIRLRTTPTAPTGVLDGATPGGVWGWTCDGDSWSDELQVRLRFFRNGGAEFQERWVRASQVRPDLVTAGVCGGTGNHGFAFEPDEPLLIWLGSGTHQVRAWAVDGPGPCGAGFYELAQSPVPLVR
jgi:hypothetical protein